MVDSTPELRVFESFTDITFLTPLLESISVEDMDSHNQSCWFMPAIYYEFDIHAHCLAKCVTPEEHTRVIEELDEFNNRNMIRLLQWLKYFVDTCLANNIVWGVGRGSSVASFVLYLLGVHRIHSIKYKLDWQEFLR
jgi:DNA polymerase III alpha subunit